MVDDMLEFEARVTNVTANLAKKTLSVSLMLEMDDESMEVAEMLASYVKQTEVIMTVKPKQMSFSMK